MTRTQVLRTTILAGCVALNATIPAQANLAAAVLPSSRSTEIDNTVTVFSTIINAGSETAVGCSVQNLSGLPFTLDYQTTDPSDNEPTGTINVPVDIPAGESQSFVLSLTPTAIVDSAEVPFSFSCTSGESAGTIGGVNTLLLSASETPVVDVIALAATIGNTGTLSLDSSAGAFSLATINIGASDTVSVEADTGNANLPVVLSLCETNSETGACLETPTASVDVDLPSGASPTFSVFSQAMAEVENNPAINRVFVRFTDSSGVVRGGTSVALVNELITNVPQFSESTLSILSRVLELLLGSFQSPSNDSQSVAASGATPTETTDIDQTLMCNTGVVEVTGVIDNNPTSSSSTLMMDFQDCDGISGMLNVVSTIEIDDNNISITVTQNGNYSTAECEEIVLAGVNSSGSIDLSNLGEDLVSENPFSLNGVISGRCGGQVFSCSLDEIDTQNEAEFVEDCSF